MQALLNWQGAITNVGLSPTLPTEVASSFRDVTAKLLRGGIKPFRRSSSNTGQQLELSTPFYMTSPGLNQPISSHISILPWCPSKNCGVELGLNNGVGTVPNHMKTVSSDLGGDGEQVFAAGILSVLSANLPPGSTAQQLTPVLLDVAPLNTLTALAYPSDPDSTKMRPSRSDMNLQASITVPCVMELIVLATPHTGLIHINGLTATNLLFGSMPEGGLGMSPGGYQFLHVPMGSVVDALLPALHAHGVDGLNDFLNNWDNNVQSSPWIGLYAVLQPGQHGGPPSLGLAFATHHVSAASTGGAGGRKPVRDMSLLPAYINALLSNGNSMQPLADTEDLGLEAVTALSSAKGGRASTAAKLSAGLVDPFMAPGTTLDEARRDLQAVANATAQQRSAVGELLNYARVA